MHAIVGREGLCGAVGCTLPARNESARFCWRYFCGSDTPEGVCDGYCAGLILSVFGLGSEPVREVRIDEYVLRVSVKRVVRHPATVQRRLASVSCRSLVSPSQYCQSCLLLRALVCAVRLLVRRALVPRHGLLHRGGSFYPACC